MTSGGLKRRYECVCGTHTHGAHPSLMQKCCSWGSFYFLFIICRCSADNRRQCSFREWRVRQAAGDRAKGWVSVHLYFATGPSYTVPQGSDEKRTCRSPRSRSLEDLTMPINGIVVWFDDDVLQLFVLFISDVHILPLRIKSSSWIITVEGLYNVRGHYKGIYGSYKDARMHS